MTEIESMTENPRIFAIESMYPENIARVFMETEKWNGMFEKLKETVRHWDEKKNEYKENVKEWGNIVREELKDIMTL